MEGMRASRMVVPSTYMSRVSSLVLDGIYNATNVSSER